eukprot:TRINITY_DN1140_c1_g1_i1.p1 TRINITY_DN1140_c1_g1~~TRINITY_DN1140_c1_g1_i1.p1  ORF type:complete len:128 (-),score=39.54 TRINITY_DN1140_c1_g1_i1:5-388(-)
MDLYFSGTASLVDEVDKKLLVVLRDGRNLIGYLRSFDQYANLVLEDTIERIYIDKEYGDIPLGLFIVRGENVVLLGEIDDFKQTNSIEVDISEILNKQQNKQQNNNNNHQPKVMNSIRNKNALNYDV